MKKFTVFTPTYNRKSTLPRLYESLVRQTEMDFEWLVVDDGSTDHTDALIQQYIQESKIKIQYVRQPNQGKHIAINTALDIISTPYFIIIDSDDYIAETCIAICQTLADDIEQKEGFAGFSFIHFSESTPYMPEKYGRKRWTEHNSYQWEFPGEMVFCFKTGIAGKFRFPVYKGETFCQEAYWLLPIFENYRILYTDYVLAYGDYLDEGLTRNLGRKLSESPQYTLATLLRKYRSTVYSKEEKKMIAMSYLDVAAKSGKIPLRVIFSEIGIGNVLLFISRKIKNIK
ncbi:glycosyltransferase family A protein [Weeksellaceae bacterium A-14]